jgi:spore cortex formation protein SpoVR/YcgB (stage V sporulation)
MLLEGSDGSIRAGIIDSNLKKSYILRIGEPQDGLELVEADMDSSEALLRKGNEVVLFKLESGDGEQMARSQPSSQQNSYAERRRALLRKIEERRKQQAEEKPPEPKLTGDALKKHLEDVQMDAIRSGRPPLPMPLTPEMDAQLVSEGVLPPQ